MPAKVQLDKGAWQWAETIDPERVTLDHVRIAYRLNLKPCKQGACRRNCKGNPKCLNCIGEREWLGEISDENWHDIEDPNNERREENSFVGLKNLGATCYVNTFLQVWFHNPNFRSAIYQWRDLENPQLLGEISQVSKTSPKKREPSPPKSPRKRSTILQSEASTKAVLDFAEVNCSEPSVSGNESNPSAITQTESNVKNPSPEKHNSSVCNQSTLHQSAKDHQTKVSSVDTKRKMHNEKITVSVLSDALKTVKNLNNKKDNEGLLAGNEISQKTGEKTVLWRDSKQNLAKEIPEYRPTSVCGHLQLIFALLQYSNRRYIDPTPLITCLGLDTGQQQDAQEFSKLLMSLLEDTLAQQSNPLVRDIIREQFSGCYAYVTRCSVCGGGSQRPSQFYELDLNIKGHKDLKECIGEFLEEEKLEGDNKYMCADCNGKQNAIRKIQLQSLPPVLNFQLLRFVFDRNTGHKKKLNTYIQFPEVLDMSQYLNKQEGAVQYDLCAVLIHRGPSAYSGHYIAHIRDRTTGHWYKFNDEEIEKMGGKNLQLGNEDDIAENKGPKRPKILKGFHASRNAYMLVYHRQGQTDTNATSTLASLEIPAYLQEAVLKDNEKFEQWIKEMGQMREQSIASGRAKHDEIKYLYKLMHVTEGEPCEFIATEWLNKWFNEDKQTPVIDNSKMLCIHDKLDPDKIPKMKCISKAAADVFYTKFGGGPRITDEMLCHECVIQQCRVIRTKARMAEDSKFFTAELKKKLSGPGCYWVGKASIRSWKRLVLESLETSNTTDKEEDSMDEALPSSGISSDLDSTPTSTQISLANESTEEQADLRFNEDLLCVDHKQLVPDVASHRLVSCEMWQRLKKYFPEAPEFKFEDSVCQQCLMLTIKDAEARDQNKALASEQKSALPDLYLDKNRPQWKNGVAVLNVINREFVEQWRRFVRDPLHREPVTCLVNRALLCDHGGFMFEIETIGATDASQIVCYVWPHEWQTLQHVFTCDEEIQISRVQEENGQTSFYSSPDVCEECILARYTQEQRELAQYTSAKIYVRKITPEFKNKLGVGIEGSNSDPPSDKDDPEFIQENGSNKRKKSSSSANTPNFPAEKVVKLDDTALRRSNRCRRVRGEKEITVASDQSLRDLKLQIMKQFSVAPFDQHLMLNGKRLTDDQAKLGALNITPGCVLHLQVDEPCEDPTLMDDLMRATCPEQGFKGTGLLGGN